MPQTPNPLRSFYRTLSGKGERPLEPDDAYYVDILEKTPEKDPILQLSRRILWADSESVDLLTGFRGNGKSTELRRLKRLLEQEGCRVFLVNMTDYLLMTKPVEISDFIISLMAALAEETRRTTGLDQVTSSYWERLGNFLTSEVKLDISAQWKAGDASAKLGLLLKSEPDFKERVQRALRGHVATLISDARNFVIDLVQAIRKHDEDNNKKVVLLIDSVEQIRGVGAEAEEVHKSVVELFSGQAANLAFRQIHLLFTIPPFLIPLAPNTGRNLGGHPISSWPNIHVRDREGNPDPAGLAITQRIIERRYPEWQNLISPEQLQRLAISSGGDLRDFFRLVREALIAASTATLASPDAGNRIDSEILDRVENQLRSELLPIAIDDGEWLARVRESKETEFQNAAELPRLARFLDSNLIMNYLNGAPWYDVHPLLGVELDKYQHSPDE